MKRWWLDTKIATIAALAASSAIHIPNIYVEVIGRIIATIWLIAFLFFDDAEGYVDLFGSSLKVKLVRLAAVIFLLLWWSILLV